MAEGHLANRWRRINLERLDQVVALLLAVQIELHVWHAASANRILPALGGLIFTVPVAFRRRWPLAGMVVVLSADALKTIIAPGSSGPLSDAAGILPALLLLSYGVGAFAPPRRSVWVVALTIVVSTANSLATPGKASSIPVNVVFIAVLPYVFGRMMRARREHARTRREEAERIDAGRDARAQWAVSEERIRIARELHDVIAHSVSVMVIQAGGARLVMDTDPDRAESSLRSVERAGRDALAEMRRLLGLLDGRPDDALAPQPGLGDIDMLLARARAAGLDAAFHVEGEPAAVPPALDLCAYRVVQEALTNAVKHAAPTHADVRVRWQADSLELEICNEGPRTPKGAPTPGGGHGLVGMRERLALHDGTLTAAAAPGGGFTVHAVFPLREAVRS
ncbi:MAG TPA: sensor histidine kinase [Acidimicrobiales bacterium]|nr:sensor histidine kinase [Acidimicrobiales bacterium]